jgi:hypothetical protein
MARPDVLRVRPTSPALFSFQRQSALNLSDRVRSHWTQLLFLTDLYYRDEKPTQSP